MKLANLKRVLEAKFGFKGTEAESEEYAIERIKEGKWTYAEMKSAGADDPGTPAEKKTSAEQLAELIGGAVAKANEPVLAAIAGLKGTPDKAPTPTPAPASGSPDPVKMFGGGSGGSGQPNVVPIKDQFSHTKSALYYPKDHKHAVLQGMPVTWLGRHMETPSNFEKAVTGAYVKWAISTQLVRAGRPVPRGFRMTDADTQLLEWAKAEGEWTGLVNTANDGHDGLPVNGRKLTGLEQKALIDDATSGGVEAAPIFFDDQVITTPLLFGELFPLVEVVNIPRGRRIEGVQFSNPTIASHTAEGSAIGTFTTTGYISALDTTIFNAVGSMEIGMDFEDDSPINVAQIVTGKYGEAAMKWLDEVIAVGDGTTEPTGLFTASGTVSVSSVNGTSGPLTIADAEQLMFGVPKQFRNTKGGRNVFFGSETMYRRFRGVPVGVADQRRVFGMDHAAYTLLDYPYKVQNDIPEGSVGFANLGYYRMYRRLGMNLRIETGGQTLASKNLMLIILRMRFGGQPTLGSSVATMEDAPTTG